MKAHAQMYADAQNRANELHLAFVSAMQSRASISTSNISDNAVTTNYHSDAVGTSNDQDSSDNTSDSHLQASASTSSVQPEFVHAGTDSGCAQIPKDNRDDDNNACEEEINMNLHENPEPMDEEDSGYIWQENPTLDDGELVDPGDGASDECFPDENDEENQLFYSEMWRDFVLMSQGPKKRSMGFIKSVQLENPRMDIMTMRTTWSSITPFTKEERDTFGPIRSMIDPDNNKKSQYVHLGLARMITFMLPKIMAWTFQGVEPPSKPHLQLEFWTDGVDLKTTGEMNSLWPVVVSVVAIGSTYQDTHRKVPAAACKPIMVSYFLSGHKPNHPNTLLQDVVDELKVLDPRDRPASDRPINEVTEYTKTVSFTASMIRFIADTPARALVKVIYGHNSVNFCEKCTAQSKYVSRKIRLYPIVGLTKRLDSKFLDYPRHVKRVSIEMYMEYIDVCACNIWMFVHALTVVFTLIFQPESFMYE
jgi:hypothetical protein